jgi:tight adherence protein B
VVEAVAVEVGADRSVVDALAAVGPRAARPLAVELAAVVDEVRRGAATTVALDRWAATSSADGAALVAAAVGLVGRAGGDGVPALRGAAATLRGRRAVERQIRALSAQARASAAVLAAAPLAFAALGVTLDGPTARFLLASPAGWACLATGGLLDAGGWWWMRRITRSVR